MVGGTPHSPYVYRAADYLDRAITITLPYDETTGELQDGTIERDQDCVYSTIYIGLGGDGSVESSSKKIPVPSGGGARTFAKGQLNAIGLVTISDVRQSQITAAP